MGFDNSGLILPLPVTYSEFPIMSVHINAAKGDIAPVCLLPGDPLRAKFIAENWLQDLQLVSSTRNMFYFTGTYKGTRISIGGSGMGCPSIGIYSWELFTVFDVQCLLRIGTAGSYRQEIGTYELLNTASACSESTYALDAFGYTEKEFKAQGDFFDVINTLAAERNQKLTAGCIHSSDVFYRQTPGLPKIVNEHHCLAVEMEAFALFSNAKFLGKTAGTLLTVSDVIPTGEAISAEKREKSLVPMFELALESAIRMAQS
jgi:purine-nucleoside phosphorylase